MNHLLAKIKGRGSAPYKVMSQDEAFFDIPDLSETHSFSAAYKLEEDEWFKINQFSTKNYQNGIIENRAFNSANYGQLPIERYQEILYFCAKQGTKYLFQKLSSTQILKRKWFKISSSPAMQMNQPIIVLNNHVDAVYDSVSDILYFKDFSKIKIMFDGIEQLYREATHDEVEDFLAQNFISLHNQYCAENVKTANRKRIAFALDSLNQYSPSEKKKIFKYIKDYCGDVPFSRGIFQIGSEEHLRKVLYGIEQRYYTTPVGNKKRLANSVLEIE